MIKADWYYWMEALTQADRSEMTYRRLLVFKWLLVLIPPVAVTVHHIVLGNAAGDLHTLLVTLVVTLLALALSFTFVEALFRVLRKLQAEALAREQELLTMRAVMQERERLSRELHDGVAQLVADVLLRMDTIQELVGANRQREAKVELERLRGVADEIYKDIEESIAGLRTNVIQRGLVRALRDYLDQFEERYQILTSLQADDAANQLSPLASLQVFRLVQEALTNVRKHAGAREATVSLTTNGTGQLLVTIADDGQGFVPGSQANGTTRPLGLTSMRERVASLGGTFLVESQPGTGTRVIATIPMSRSRKEDEYATPAPPPR
jgi:signal transduction histidine kinase